MTAPASGRPRLAGLLRPDDPQPGGQPEAEQPPAPARIPAGPRQPVSPGDGDWLRSDAGGYRRWRPPRPPRYWPGRA